MSISKSTINTVTSSIRRADQMFAEQVGENTTLDHGIAFWDQDYPTIVSAQQPPLSVKQTFDLNF